jgi:hypothetical protein
MMLVETEQSFHSKLRSTWIITHKGFHRTVMVNTNNEIIKDSVNIYKNHKKNCPCDYDKTELIVFNSREVRRTEP